jgi:hypothetical protein
MEKTSRILTNPSTAKNACLLLSQVGLAFLFVLNLEVFYLASFSSSRIVSWFRLMGGMKFRLFIHNTKVFLPNFCFRVFVF